MSFDAEMEEIHKIFFEESHEGLDAMESGLLNLDASADRETINTIFRAAHSIKGGAATFGFTDVANFTHDVETLLDEMRNGKRTMSSQAQQLLLQSVDCIRDMIKAAQAGGKVDARHVAILNESIKDLLATGDLPVSTPRPAVPPAPVSSGPPATEAQTAMPAPPADGPGWIVRFVPHEDILRTNNEPTRMFAELARLGTLTAEADVAAVPSLEDLVPESLYLRWTLRLAGNVERRRVQDVFDWVDASSKLDYEEVAAPRAAEPKTASGAAAASTAEPPAAPQPPKAAPAPKNQTDTSSIRVSIDKVDSLINLVGELVITQSMLSQFGERFDASQLEHLRQGLSHLSRNTRDLQESVMQIRMLPIGFAFNRFPRLVHDLSRKLNKQVDLRLSGESTELDKTVLEKISDPLVHLVRNALDHGLETPEARIAAGKDPTGTIELNAYHEGGSIIVEVKDDGAGLKKARILARARERGLVAADAELSDDQIHNLIFQPGFSTAETVSEVSGRGVGMDVVKRNINDLGGHVQISSQEGRGSTIKIRLPLTLAILDGQLVRVGAETYVISLLAIVETIQVKEEQVNRLPGGVELFRLRSEYLPIIDLAAQFGTGRDPSTACDGLLVVVESDGRRFGLLVDDLLAQQQVVIKSLESSYRQVRGLAGATILGDGRVALILDVPGLVQTFEERHAEATAKIAAA
jgi:two-component system, chemotaxis family, sensor kinase CheA